MHLNIFQLGIIRFCEKYWKIVHKPALQLYLCHLCILSLGHGKAPLDPLGSADLWTTRTEQRRWGCRSGLSPKHDLRRSQPSVAMKILNPVSVKKHLRHPKTQVTQGNKCVKTIENLQVTVFEVGEKKNCTNCTLFSVQIRERCRAAASALLWRETSVTCPSLGQNGPLQQTGSLGVWDLQQLC